MYGERPEIGWAIYEMVKPVVSEALLQAGISEDQIRWTGMRDDSLNLTVEWPKESPRRSINIYRSGNWPRYSLDAEVNLWEEDEVTSERNIQTYPVVGQQGESAGIVTVAGSALNPQVTLYREEEMRNGISERVRRLNEPHSK